MIKRLFLVIIITTCVLSSIFAQDGKNAKFGIKGGLNVSNIYGKNIDGNDAKSGFHLGIFIECPLSNKWYLQPEIMYSEQGLEGEDAKLELNYVTIPFMFKYYISRVFNIEFGPQFNYALNAKISNDEASLEIGDKMNQRDLTAGFNFGCGLHFSSHFAISARYNLGLTNIADESRLFGDGKFKNTVFQLSLAFKF